MFRFGSDDTDSGSHKKDDDRALDRIPLLDFAGESLTDDLAYWAVCNNITHSALTELLSVLTWHDVPALPKCARTVLKTPRDIELQEFSNGQYYHFGLKESIMSTFDEMCLRDIEDGTVLNLQLNADGLPIGRSSKGELWPLCAFVRMKYYSEMHNKEVNITSKVFMIGCFFGIRGKPESVNEYLNDFVNDYLDLQNTGLVVNDSCTCTVKLTVLVCDTPARAFLTSTYQHNHLYACNKCEEKGESIGSRTSFAKLNGKLRTDASFAAKSQKQHHRIGNDSPLERTGFGMVTGVVGDYMHNFLGVVKNILSRAVKPKGNHKLLGSKLRTLNARIAGARATCPSDFARRPRSLRLLAKFKATELRTFACYTVIAVGKGMFATRIFENFKLLFCALRILLSPGLCSNVENIRFAGYMLKLFVQQFGKIYGTNHVVYKVHSMIHVADDAEMHGNLDNFSCFPFENYLGSLKKIIRTPACTLKQVVNRTYERRYLKVQTKHRSTLTRCLHMHRKGPLPDEVKQRNCEVTQHEAVVTGDPMTGGTQITTEEGDNAVIVNDRVGIVVNIIRTVNSGKVEAVIEFFQDYTDAFDTPLPSSAIGVMNVSNRSPKQEMHDICSCSKCWLITVGDTCTAIQLLQHV